MDRIHLDKARMTKTPLPSLADEEWEALKAEESVGGTVLFFFFFFYWLMTSPFLSLNGPFHRNQLLWVDGHTISSGETSHLRTRLDLHVWMHCIRVLETWRFKHTSWLSWNVKHFLRKGNFHFGQSSNGDCGDVPTEVWKSALSWSRSSAFKAWKGGM